jgi:type 1 glutamine amidotransferase
MWISPDVKPLLTTDCPTSDPTIAWISPWPKSKVVYIQLGHGHGSFDHPSFRALVHNAILWSANRLKEEESK